MSREMLFDVCRVPVPVDVPNDACRRTKKNRPFRPSQRRIRWRFSKSRKFREKSTFRGKEKKSYWGFDRANADFFPREPKHHDDWFRECFLLSRGRKTWIDVLFPKPHTRLFGDYCLVPEGVFFPAGKGEEKNQLCELFSTLGEESEKLAFWPKSAEKLAFWPNTVEKLAFLAEPGSEIGVLDEREMERSWRFGQRRGGYGRRREGKYKKWFVV